MWLKTVDSVCTKIRKIVGQTLLHFGSSDLEVELSRDSASRVGLRLCMCALTTELYLFASCSLSSMAS